MRGEPGVATPAKHIGTPEDCRGNPDAAHQSLRLGEVLRRDGGYAVA